MSPEIKEFVSMNFKSMTVVDLHKKVVAEMNYNFTLHYFRMQLYSSGLKKMNMQYWTDEQTSYLKENYKTKGDKELAEIFNQKWIKEKGWTLKHMEKKRSYLKLKRTAEELYQIKKRATEKGVYAEGHKKMWQTRGMNPLGKIVIWDGDKYIKTAKGYIHLRVFNYKIFKGEIPKGTLVNHIDTNRLNCDPENLQVLTRAENALKNNWSKYPAELRRSILLVGRINKQLKKTT